MASAAPTFTPINTAETSPADFDSLIRIQSSLRVPHFTAADAWDVGSLLRTRLLYAPRGCVISISLSTGQPLFFATSGLSPNPSDPSIFDASTIGSGTNLDNASWVARKTKTVLRFGIPSYALGVKFGGDETMFRKIFGMGEEEAGAYAIHGGAVPVQVKGVEGIAAVIVVSGLKQDEDHGVVVEILGTWIKSLQA